MLSLRGEPSAVSWDAGESCASAMALRQRAGITRATIPREARPAVALTVIAGAVPTTLATPPGVAVFRVSNGKVAEILAYVKLMLSISSCVSVKISVRSPHLAIG